VTDAPAINDDFIDILRALNDQSAEFVIVGAYALAVHGFPRATGDIDLFVKPTPENAAKVYAALLEFGAPVAAHGVARADFVKPGMVYQIGLPPRRIDILTSISGVSFDEANARAVKGRLGPCEVSFIGLDALIENKRSTGRTKDAADVEQLEKLPR
jgi:predicted nucleotidyltransferase